MENLKIVKKIISKQKEEMVEYDGCLYTAAGVSIKKGMRWRCVTRNGCPGKVFTSLSYEILSVVEHKHDDTNKSGLRKIVHKKLIDDAVATNEPPKDIICRIIETMNTDERSLLPNFKSMRNTITLARRKENGVTTAKYDDIPEKYKRMPNNDTFILLDTGYEDDNRVVIMGTYENMAILGDCKCWLVDGTFHVAPSEFEQLYVFQANVMGVNAPLAYALMKKKSSVAYDILLYHIKKFTKYSLPDYIVLDFEKGAINSLTEAFGHFVKIRGCIFHFGQAIWRKIGNLGFASEYKNDKDIALFFRMFLSLAFVPADYVLIEYEKILTAIRNSNCFEKFKDFIKYYERNYIGSLDCKNKSLKEPRYAIEFWNVHSRVLENLPRTTNSLEGWNRNIKEVVRIAHPNIINLIIALQKEQTFYEKRMLELSRKIFSVASGDRFEVDLKNVCSNYQSYKGLLYLKTIASLYNWKLDLKIPTSE